MSRRYTTGQCLANADPPLPIWRAFIYWFMAQQPPKRNLMSLSNGTRHLHLQLFAVNGTECNWANQVMTYPRKSRYLGTITCSRQLPPLHQIVIAWGWRGNKSFALLESSDMWQMSPLLVFDANGYLNLLLQRFTGFIWTKLPNYLGARRISLWNWGI